MSAELTPQQRVADRYRIGRLVDEDNDVMVYEAVDEQTNQPVFVRAVRPERVADGRLAEGLRQRTAVAGRVDGAGLVPLLDADLDATPPILVERAVHGRSLAQRLEDGQTFTWNEAASIGREAARALAGLHRAGITHGHIDPSNVFLTDAGEVYLTDLGRPAPAATTRRAAQYVAPEQLAGDAADPRSDVYSLAAVIYTLVAGGPPYDAADAATIAATKRTTSAPSLNEMRPDVPGELGVTIDQAMAHDPARRPPNGQALLEALTHGPATPVVRRRERRSPWPAVLAALIGLLLLGLLAFALFTTEVPNVVGLTEAEARGLLVERDLDPDTIEYQPTTTAVAGTVLTQTPDAGDRVWRNEDVHLVVAQGDIPIDAVFTPQLLGRTQSAAIDEIREHGLEVGTVSPGANSTQPAGVVLWQSPSATTQVRPGTPVHMVVNTYDAPPIDTVIETMPTVQREYIIVPMETPQTLPPVQRETIVVPETREVPVPVPVPVPQERAPVTPQPTEPDTVEPNEPPAARQPAPRQPGAQQPVRPPATRPSAESLEGVARPDRDTTNNDTTPVDPDFDAPAPGTQPGTTQTGR